jgi:hypothetical protein
MPTAVPLARDVIDSVRIACTNSGRQVVDAEITRALEGLSEAELKAVLRVARNPPSARPLGPEAFLDIARGVEPGIAAAREISGYYELKAERDTLATLTSRADRATQPPERARVETTPPPSPAAAAASPAVPLESAPVSGAVQKDQQAMMTLFAYHRDAVRVAQELGISIFELNERIETLGLRRRIHRLLESTTDIDLFSPERVSSTRSTTTPTPVVRRRTERAEERPELPFEPPVEAPSRSTPVASSEPVNAHGTRVYRRTETTPAEVPPAAGTGRREYVREPKRSPKPARPAPAKAKAVPPPPPAKRSYAELESSAGAAAIERLLTDEKANPRLLAARLAEQYEGPSGPLKEDDFRALLQRHGLDIAFREREIANTRFLIGFHQGARGKLANALQMNTEDLNAYLTRLDLLDELDRVRADRARLELGRRKMSDRVVQVLTRAPYLDDIGVLKVIDREVREHLEEKLSVGPGEEGLEAFRGELGLEKNAFAKLLRRYGMENRGAE